MNRFIIERSFQDLDNRFVLTHWQDGLELLRVVEGSMQCLINGVEYTIHKDDVCVINKNQLHRIYCDNKEESSFQCLIIEPGFFTADKRIYEEFVEPILDDIDFSHTISTADEDFSKEIVGLMDSIEAVEKSGSKGYELLIIGILHVIFQKIYVKYEGEIRIAHRTVDTNTLVYRKMANFIYNHYEDKISLQDIADAGYISRNKCCDLFKKYAMQTPGSFLNMYRLEKSTEFLRNTDNSISSISSACGFGQPSYYTRLFQKRYEMTPKAYRNWMRESMAI
ncbi:MAG: AraC family transcriptional regulator [Eubacteriales bacterium]|nr:AraC family transcriptional regulator [Eubacteriales bacterium]